jgi:hypothetical protein
MVSCRLPSRPNLIERSWRWRIVEPFDIDRKLGPQSGQSVNFFLKSGLGASAAMVAKPVRAPL